MSFERGDGVPGGQHRHLAAGIDGGAGDVRGERHIGQLQQRRMNSGFGLDGEAVYKLTELAGDSEK